MQHYSGYGDDDIKPWADKMLGYLQQAVQHRSIFKKYSSKKLMKASLFVEAWIRKTWPECALAQAPPTCTD